MVAKNGQIGGITRGALQGPTLRYRPLDMGSILSSMKVKTSITLSSEVLAKIDRLMGSTHTRSAFIENVLCRYVLEHERAPTQAETWNESTMAPIGLIPRRLM